MRTNKEETVCVCMTVMRDSEQINSCETAVCRSPAAGASTYTVENAEYKLQHKLHYLQRHAGHIISFPH